MTNKQATSKQKVAIVTGAGAGIGEAIAKRFAIDGMHVVIAEFNSDTGASVSEQIQQAGGSAEFVHTDVTDLHSVQSMIDAVLSKHTTVDVLVNNAYPVGEMPANAVEQGSERLQRAMNGGFHSAVLLMKAVHVGMAEQGWGRVVNICSLNGVNAHSGTSDYNSAKEALRAYTRTIAVEWAQDGITANIICPGAKTSSYKMMEEFAPDMIGDILKLVPMGYMGDPYEDIAPVAAFLVSDDAKYMTGNTLFVDGGGHINGVPWKP